MHRFIIILMLLPALSPGSPDMKWLDINRWSCAFHNDGRWGHDPTRTPSGAGGYWPAPLKNYYIFGAGPWVGSIVNSDTLVTYGYSPNAGNTEFGTTLCRYWREPGPLDRIYKYPGDWPPPRDRFPMAPQEPRADMQLWCAFGDSNPANHIPPGRPLGVDIYLTVFGFSDSLARDFFFLKYELVNFGGAELTNTYFALVMDPDIGEHADDMVGLLLNDTVAGFGRVRDVGFAGDYDNIEVPNPRGQWEEGTPGVVAVKLLQAPNGLGLTAFKKFVVASDPVTDPAQYLTMAGYDYWSGEYNPYDSIDLVPADKRFLMSTGPFDLAPDSVATFWYAVIGAPYGGWGQTWEQRRLPYNDSLLHLAWQCRHARQRFEWMLGVAEPEAPKARLPHPVPTLIRGSLNLHASVFTPHASVFLLDISGRRVMELQPGENDVRQLAPGVYFIRAQDSRGQGFEGASVRRVVITK